MSTLIITDSFACRIEVSTVRKWTIPLSCTHRVTLSAQFSLSFWTDTCNSCRATA